MIQSKQIQSIEAAKVITTNEKQFISQETLDTLFSRKMVQSIEDLEVLTNKQRKTLADGFYASGGTLYYLREGERTAYYSKDQVDALLDKTINDLKAYIDQKIDANLLEASL